MGIYQPGWPMKIEDDPAQHGDWSTRQAIGLLANRLKLTAGDSLEGRFQSVDCTPSILETLDYISPCRTPTLLPRVRYPYINLTHGSLRARSTPPDTID